MELIDILDRSGLKRNYTKERHDELNEEEFALVVHVWIRNSDGKYLVQQRAETKEVDPLLWSITSGFVNNHETSLDTVYRELKEELNLDFDVFKVRQKHTLNPRNGFHHIVDVYMLDLNLELDKLSLQEEEVKQVDFWTQEEIEEKIKAHEFYDFTEAYDEYFNYIF